MLNRRQQYGQNRERLAENHLRRRGYKILERNYRTPFGEIDLVARHQKAIVFVEVKARRSRRFGLPQEAVTPTKQRKLSMAALAYLKHYGTVDTDARFDVVTVQDRFSPPRIEVISNAFELAYP
jgi:putative endonuclease